MRRRSLVSFSALLLALSVGGASAGQAQGAFKVDEAAAARGKKVWNSKQCSGCHELGRNASTGPDLIGVTERRSTEWLRKWLKDPVSMAGDDSIAAALKRQYNYQMPKLGLTDSDATALINYLAEETRARRGK